jgi:hypothetical protein
VLARLALNALNLPDHIVKRGGHERVQESGIVPDDEVRFPSITVHQVLQFLTRDAGRDGRVRDLVPVEVEDWQRSAVMDRIEELIRVPSGGEGSCLRLAVTHDTGDHEAGIVEGRPKGMAKRIPQFAALVDGAGGSPERHGSECRREKRTAGRGCGALPRPA